MNINVELNLNCTLIDGEGDFYYFLYKLSHITGIKVNCVAHNNIKYFGFELSRTFKGKHLDGGLDYESSRYYIKSIGSTI